VADVEERVIDSDTVSVQFGRSCLLNINTHLARSVVAVFDLHFTLHSITIAIQLYTIMLSAQYTLCVLMLSISMFSGFFFDLCFACVSFFTITVLVLYMHLIHHNWWQINMKKTEKKERIET